MRANITGNLTEDPELRFTQSGVAFTRLRIAENRRYKDRNNEWQEETSFHTAVCWRELAENVAKSLTKGMRVMIDGRQTDRTYDDSSGQKRTVKEITADEIGPSLRWAESQVTRNPRQDGAGGDGQQQPAAPPNRSAEPTPVAGGGGGFDPYTDEEPF